VGGPPPPAEIESRVEIYSEPGTPLPHVWRGVVMDRAGRIGAASWSAALSALKARGAGVVSWPSESQSSRAERDVLLAAAAQEGIDSNLMVPAMPGRTTKGWLPFFEGFLGRYSGSERYGITRWDLDAASGFDAERWSSFQRHTRGAQPFAPIGLLLDFAAIRTGFADELAASGSAPDSIAWRCPAGSAAQSVRAARHLLAGTASLSGTTLWLHLAPEPAESPAAYVAAAIGAAGAAPSGQPNALGGVLIPFDTAFDPTGAATATADALGLVNRVSGIRLRESISGSMLHCVATRAVEGAVRMIVWTARAVPAGERGLLRLHGFGDAFSAGARISIFRPSGGKRPEKAMEPVAVSDAAPWGAADLEIPVVLDRTGVVMVTIEPGKPSPVSLTAESPRSTYLGGDEWDLALNVRNTSSTAVPGDIRLAADPTYLAPRSTSRLPVGTLLPGKSRAVQLRIFLPQSASRQVAYATVSVRDTRASVAVVLEPSIVVTVLTPRVDLANANSAGSARLSVANRSPRPAALSLRRSDDSSDSALAEQPFAVAGGKSTVAVVNVQAPSRDPGVYSESFDLMSEGRSIDRLDFAVGVPVACRFAASTPSMQLDPATWPDAEPLGMGHADQMGGKPWRGPADLSAIAYLSWDNRFLYVGCAVTDDVLVMPASVDQIRYGDSILVAVDAGAGSRSSGSAPQLHCFGMALTGGGAKLVRFAGLQGPVAGAVPDALVSARREGHRTVYTAAIPWSALSPAQPAAGAQLRFAIRVVDRDDTGTAANLAPIGWADWQGAIDRSQSYCPLRLVR
jgi:hypothetical protein